MQEQEIKVIEVDIDSVFLNDENCRITDKHQEAILQASIENDPEYMKYNCIKVDAETKKIMIGNQRYKICKKLGWKTIPVMFVKNKDMKQFIARALKDNVHCGVDDYDELKKLSIKYGLQQIVMDEINVRVPNNFFVDTDKLRALEIQSANDYDIGVQKKDNPLAIITQKETEKQEGITNDVIAQQQPAQILDSSDIFITKDPIIETEETGHQICPYCNGTGFLQKKD